MIEVLIFVGMVAAILQYLDASAGMSFGEITALLIVLGFAPLEVVPAVVLASAVLSSIAGFMHYRAGNVTFKKDHSLYVLAALCGFGIAAIVLGAFVATHIPEVWLTGYIGVIVIILGALILSKWKTKLKFSWPRLLGVGVLASFNKGMTGGGYGPVLASGQILAGVKSKQAVSITAISEGVVSTVGFLSFIFAFNAPFNGPLIAALILGGLTGTPLAIFSVKTIDPKHLRLAVGIVSMLLGLFIVGRFVLHVF